MSQFDDIREQLRASPKRWLITGTGGFIASALAEELLALGQSVVGIDSFVTGHRHNVDSVKTGARNPDLYRFIEGDIRDLDTCRQAMEGIDVVLHQAAMGSVPRSIADPLTTHHHNVTGFLNILVAARDARVPRMVYASSSSVYGDHPGLPKQENLLGEPMSPYAVSKRVDEMYGAVFSKLYELEIIGLRYFNVFGRRQDPAGQYAAVIPRWIDHLARNEECVIFGDGSSSRDFCYIDNVVQANLLAATADSSATGTIYNVGTGSNTNLLDLLAALRANVSRYVPAAANSRPRFAEPRPGDVPHSQASIERISRALGYVPTHDVAAGLGLTVDWFMAKRSR